MVSKMWRSTLSNVKCKTQAGERKNPLTIIFISLPILQFFFATARYEKNIIISSQYEGNKKPEDDNT